MDKLLKDLRNKVALCGNTREERARKGAYVDCIVELEKIKTEKEEHIRNFIICCISEMTEDDFYNKSSTQYVDNYLKTNIIG